MSTGDWWGVAVLAGMLGFAWWTGWREKRATDRAIEKIEAARGQTIRERRTRW